jgi:hypothetical protein
MVYRPYDYVVVPHRDSLGPAHAILSSSGAVLVHPGEATECVPLGRFNREIETFSALKDIPFFKNYYLIKVSGENSMSAGVP